MKAIRKIIKWILLMTLGIVGLFVLNIGWHRLRGPTPDEAAALALVEAPVAKPQGRNAFALTWLFSKDVAEADIEELAARDVEYARNSTIGSNEKLQFSSAQLSDLDLPKSGVAALCDSYPEKCLNLVRKNLEATRELLAKHDQLVKRAASLEDYEYFRSEFPRRFSMPVIYSMPSQQLRIGRLALMFVDGERNEAIAGVCRNLSMWRRFGRDNRELIQTMIAVSRRDVDIQLFASMLAELQPGESLPEECSTALDPVATEEVSMCSSMMGELDYTDAILESIITNAQSGKETGWFERHAQPLVLDAAQTRAWRALNVARYCNAEVSTQVLLDQRVENQPLDIDWLDCASNLIGCTLVSIAAPGYDDYQERLLDSSAHLRLAATVAWLRESGSSGQSLQERFDARPESMRSGIRATGISEDGHAIWVDNLFTQRAARYSLPLAVSKESTP